MTPEIEVLDQLLGGDLPLNVIAGLFPSLSLCQTALSSMVLDGQVNVLDPSGSVIPAWRLRELWAECESWRAGTEYRVTVTDEGARRVR